MSNKKKPAPQVVHTPPKEWGLTCYVTVTIPIGLVFDEAVSPEYIRSCALDNFLEHPAMSNGRELDKFVDNIVVEPSSLV